MEDFLDENTDEDIDLDKLWDDKRYTEKTWINRVNRMRVFCTSFKPETDKYGKKIVLRFDQVEIIDGDEEAPEYMKENYYIGYGVKEDKTCGWTHCLRALKKLDVAGLEEVEGRWVTIEKTPVPYGFRKGESMLPVALD